MISLLSIFILLKGPGWRTISQQKDLQLLSWLFSTSTLRGEPPARPSNPTNPPGTTAQAWYERDQQGPGDLSSAPNQRGTGKEVVFYYCHRPSHEASVGPICNAKLLGTFYGTNRRWGMKKLYYSDSKMWLLMANLLWLCWTVVVLCLWLGRIWCL